ncbi:Sel1 repeat-containing protein [Cohaesibacter sp. ES.047]|uniref:peptidoglycan-binding protein n=1 Tax=Cohaesibacter sp. ES.047 TaxID=1798205 RepID=UPI000BB821D5|nr:peptidoglycan-binding protein [Cohaesibacter sp. ES.047]SNY91913.1 Sel1 repeat-containing protein [Cohaesibacter sp. ES.047]
MIDETFHTDRDVGEFIEGLRGASNHRKRRGRSRRKPDQVQAGDRAALLDMIKDMELQIASLSGEDDYGHHSDRAYSDETETLRSGRLRNNEGFDAPRSSSARRRPSAKTDGTREDYRSALERIEAQLARVDNALERKTERQPKIKLERVAPKRQRGQDPLMRGDVRQPAPTQTRSQSRARNAASSASSSNGVPAGVDQALRQLMQRVQDITPAMQEVRAQDDKLNRLREDVASLRDLLEQANFSGASERLLNEIAALSGRIDAMTAAISESRHEPELRDAIHDIHSLLDKSAYDPSIQDHFERILDKLDNLPLNHHYDDFAKLSAQIDNLRDILSAAPRAQHFSHISGQMSMLVDRLGALEDDVRRSVNQSPQNDQMEELLEERLAHLQQMMERVDPNDRLLRLEEQLTSLADGLEDTRGESDSHSALEALARQVESLVKLISQQNQHTPKAALDTLANQMAALDQRLREGPDSSRTEHRFDQVEQTLARIDDMLHRKMDSVDLSTLETGLSRLADRMEAQEEVLRDTAHGTVGGFVGIEQLERQIADLAGRLDGSSRGDQDPQFLDSLTSRLDALTEQFARSQSRFDAVDRIGQDIQQLAANRPNGPVNESKIAEEAAMRALQRVGPIGAGKMDGALEVIIDGLKDDLHGLRTFAESSENTTQRNLHSVSSMLNTIVERLGALEGEVRTSEDQDHAASSEPAPQVRMSPPRTSEDGEPDPEKRSLGQMLRRSQKGRGATSGSQQAAAPGQNAQSMSAADLLAGRGRTRAAERADATAAQMRSDPDGARQPGIRLTGKAAQTAQAAGAARGQSEAAPQARRGQIDMGGAPQVHGNVALKADPHHEPMHDAPNAPQQQPRQPQPKRGAQIVGGSSSAATAPRQEGGSKADFIAAARRAAQAAAQESARVEQEEGEAKGFLARFKGSKKPKDQQATEEQAKAPLSVQPAEDLLKGLNRKERRAAIAEAARKAKSAKGDELAQALEDDEAAALAAGLVEDEEVRKSLFARIGGAVSRHSRPLLIAAAAILLAITTLQLAKNPESSLHGLFNSMQSEQTATVEPAASDAPAEDTSNAATPDAPTAPGDQSSVMPYSGSLVPDMTNQEANRVITFAQPSGAQGPMNGPRRQNAPVAQAPQVAQQLDPMTATAMTTPNVNPGIDYTPTSSIPSTSNAMTPQQQAKAEAQPMPPVLDQGATDADASVQAAVDMNKMLSPGISQTPLMTAAQNGDALAQFEVGRRMTLGEGMTVDLKKAADWFEKAASQSMPQAQYSLANLYEKGKGVKKDLQVARLWYQRAAETGNVKAMHNLAVLYASGGLGKPDFSQASKWFIQAADHGLKDSQYNLAILYARGMGVKQDLLQSYKWFALAAKNGDQGATSKRDEVLNVLNASQQKAAKAMVETWVPKVAKPSANNLATLPEEWQLKAPQEVTGKVSQKPGPKEIPMHVIVAKAQSMLGALGYNAGPSDGQMGPRTRSAIRNFQEVAGLPVTGEIDRALLEELALRVI